MTHLLADEAMIAAHGVAKKHVRSLKRSMRYGMVDIFREFFGIPATQNNLRPEEFWAVDDVSFTLYPGESLAIIGPNGAGKSTLLKILNGIIWPDRGRVQIKGRVGSLIEVGAGFHPMLSGRENIYVNGAILGLRRKEIHRLLDAIVAFSGLEEFIDSPVKFYSSGMYVRLGFSIAIHAAPQILLVDEVLAVGDGAFQRKCLRAMKRHASQGGCLVFVTHDMLAVNTLATRAIVLDKGRIAFEGSPGDSVDVYYRHTLKSDKSRAASRNRPDEIRYGRGEALLTGIGFGPCIRESVTVGKTKPLIASEQAEVRIAIHSQRNGTGPYHVGISIWEEEGLPLATMNTQSRGINIPPLQAGESIVVIFRFNCPLAAGHYRVSAGVLDIEKGDFQDRRLNWVKMEVVGCGDVFGILSIPFQVNVEPNPNILNDPHNLTTEDLQ
jgi:ABC-type polysaccharide/polyol phosphate transport system ATPase subunit